ncbi:peptidylprolyl isomerase [Gaopeijia maritima]|uniref:peptidylprolyl isomerase n=1 Tax=Gaopeijia maritima TaxID=3119007 RepID=A0ABU9EBU8_9BACT
MIPRMRAWRTLLPLLGAALVAASCGGDSGSAERPEDSNPLLQPADFQETAPDDFRVAFETTEGRFVVEAHRAWAPRGVDRFYNLVRAGYYDGVPFHRVLEGFVVDFGIHPDPWVNAAWRQARMRDDPVLQSNRRGYVTFSKSEVDTRTVQIFVNLADNPDLDDDGFAPFGTVVEGMETVEALYGDYGDGPPRGDGVYQAMAIAKGDEYFAEFPELDRIVRAELIE